MCRLSLCSIISGLSLPGCAANTLSHFQHTARKMQREKWQILQEANLNTMCLQLFSEQKSTLLAQVYEKQTQIFYQAWFSISNSNTFGML